MSAEPQVLIVEDGAKIGSAVRDYLAASGYAASWLATGEGAVEWIRQHAPDAVLLDVMLPGEDGLRICRPGRWPLSPQRTQPPVNRQNTRGLHLH